MNFSSKYIEQAVNHFSKFPGIGKKTALRMVLHMLSQPLQEVENFSRAMVEMKEKLKKCTRCFNYADQDICSICAATNRKQQTICVVETMREVMAIENTGQYQGVYHVLGGVISPINGIGPNDLSIPQLLQRVKEENTEELIMAISPTIEGDTTIFYISKKLEDAHVSISTISRGIAFGAELEYTDEITLGRSITSRLPYQIQKEL
jgi:recombination protein RecR